MPVKKISYKWLFCPEEVHKIDKFVSNADFVDIAGKWAASGIAT